MTALTRRAALAFAATATATAAVVALSRTARAADATASIENFSFTPATLTVPAGTKVTWTNNDDIPHTVTSAASPKLFHSPALDTGEAFSFVFDTPGTFGYFCALHPHMQGTVVVT
jgi:plastocyanin